MNAHRPLDSFYGVGRLDTDYELKVVPGDGHWRPSIHIEPRDGETWVFVQSFDDLDAFTPGYLVATPPLTRRFWDFGVYSLPEDVAVQKWMPPAIERAGFRYDPVPNNERRDRSPATVKTHPDQTTFSEVAAP